MFLKNWYNILGTIIMADGTATANGRMYAVDFKGAGKYVINEIYNVVSLYEKAMFQPMFPSSAASNHFGVVFGDGSVEPTLDDYKLSGTILLASDASATGTCVSTMNSDTGEASLTGTYTITNKRDTDIVIREVGIMLNVKGASTATGSASNSYFMVERTLLDEPVTISPGGFGQVVYTVKMNFPTT